MNCNTFRDIQTPIQFWKLRGVFLGIFFIQVIICLIVVIIAHYILVKLLFLSISVILYLILKHYSKKDGVRDVKKVVGKLHEPKLIIVTDPSFYFKIKRDNK